MRCGCKEVDDGLRGLNAHERLCPGRGWRSPTTAGGEAVRPGDPVIARHRGGHLASEAVIRTRVLQLAVLGRFKAYVLMHSAVFAHNLMRLVRLRPAEVPTSRLPNRPSADGSCTPSGANVAACRQVSGGTDRGPGGAPDILGDHAF